MQLAHDIARLRAVVGYLGEKSQYAWWPSSFLTKSSQPFLSPMFPKTSFLSQYYGVRDAAAVVHDAHIGVGQEVFHLFRLPESLEIGLHQYLSNDGATHLANLISSKEACHAALVEMASGQTNRGVGPVRIGRTGTIRQTDMWKVVAAHYERAFQEGSKAFPYFYREP